MPSWVDSSSSLYGGVSRVSQIASPASRAATTSTKMPAAMACDLFSISMVHNVSPANKAWGRGPQSIHNSGRGLQNRRARRRGTPSKGRPAVRVSSPPAKREGGRREATQGGFSYRAHRAPAALALEEMLDERMLELGHLARRAADQHRSEEHTSALQSPCNLVCR